MSSMAPGLSGSGSYAQRRVLADKASGHALDAVRGDLRGQVVECL
jgi:hypothetical protein